MAANGSAALMRRFWHDRAARLAPAAVRPLPAGRAVPREFYALPGDEEKDGRAAAALFVFLAAALYVTARIGLTYAILGQ